MGDPERPYQLLDGPEDLLRCHTREELVSLLRSGQVPPAARVVELTTLKTLAAYELLAADDPLAQHAAEVAKAPKPTHDNQVPARRSGPQAADQGPVGELPPGTVWGRYRTERLLGKGGMGEVYLAIRADDGEKVALKILPQALSSDAELVKRFHREAAATAAIDSEYVVKNLATGEHQGRPFQVMEYIEGANLAQKLQQGFRFPPEEVARVGIQVGKALWAAAKKGMVHRDIKPGNIILGRTCGAKLLDFGLVRLNRDASRLTQLTQAGVVMGSLRYMAPEQAQGAECDHRSDIYALGVTLYELMTGKPPFQAKDMVQLLRQHQNDHPRPLEEAAPEMPPWLNRVVMTCLAKDPASRYQSSMDLVRELEAGLGGKPQRRASASGPVLAKGTRAPLPAIQAMPGSQRSRTMPLLLLAVVVAIAAGGGWFWHVHRNRSATASSTAAEDSGRPAPTALDPSTVPGWKPAVPSTAPAPTSAQARPAETLLARYQEAEAAAQWQDCWTVAREFMARFPERIEEARLRLPLAIESDPPGATVWLEGVSLGTTPYLHRYRPGDTGTLVLIQAGRALASIDLAQIGKAAWKYQSALAPLPELAWAVPLPAPVKGRMLVVNDRICLTAGDDLLVFLDPADGSQRPVRLEGGPPVDSPRLHRGVVHVLHRSGLEAVSTATAQVLWRTTTASGTVNTAAEPVFFTVADHELNAERAKIWIVTRCGDLACLATTDAVPEALVPARPGVVASAGPAVQICDIAESAIVVPAERRVHFYAGATAGPEGPPRLAFTWNTQHPVSLPVVPVTVDEIPAMALVDTIGTVQLLDVRPGIEAERRLRGQWQLQGRPVGLGAVGKGSRWLIGLLNDGTLAGIAFDRPDRPAWKSSGTPAAGLPWLDPAMVVVATADGLIRWLGTEDGREQRSLRLGVGIVTGPVQQGRTVVLATTCGFIVGIRSP